MFAGEVLCLMVSLLGRCIWTPSSDEKPDATICQKLWFIIPAIFDTLNVAFSLTGLTMTAAGVYQMMLGGVSFWTFFLAICYLKTRYRCRHYFGLTVLIAGLALVGVASIVWSKVFFNIC